MNEKKMNGGNFICELEFTKGQNGRKEYILRVFNRSPINGRPYHQIACSSISEPCEAEHFVQLFQSAAPVDMRAIK